MYDEDVDVDDGGGIGGYSRDVEGIGCGDSGWACEGDMWEGEGVRICEDVGEGEFVVVVVVGFGGENEVDDDDKGLTGGWRAKDCDENEGDRTRIGDWAGEGIGVDVDVRSVVCEDCMIWSMSCVNESLMLDEISAMRVFVMVANFVRIFCMICIVDECNVFLCFEMNDSNVDANDMRKIFCVLNWCEKW